MPLWWACDWNRDTGYACNYSYTAQEAVHYEETITYSIPLMICTCFETTFLRRGHRRPQACLNPCFLRHDHERSLLYSRTCCVQCITSIASLSSISSPLEPLFPFRPLVTVGEIGSPISETGLLKSSSSEPSGLFCWLSLKDFLVFDIYVR